jgi:hypothetical protein
VNTGSAITFKHVNKKAVMHTFSSEAKLVYGTLIGTARRWRQDTMCLPDYVFLKSLRKAICNKHQDDRITCELEA